ncbi:MAG: hypothetical protein R3D58_23615 [Saprospiraceae bacterium]|nr:hypothetical protein [Lewinellaceae bacterium]
MTTTQLILLIGLLLFLVQALKPNQVVIVRDRNEHWGCSGILGVIVLFFGVLLIAYLISANLSDTPARTTPARNDRQGRRIDQAPDKQPPLINHAPPSSLLKSFNRSELFEEPEHNGYDLPENEPANRNIYEPRPNAQCAVLLKRFLNPDGAGQLCRQFSHWGAQVFTIENEELPYWVCVPALDHSEAWNKIESWYDYPQEFESYDLDFEIIVLEIVNEN